MGNEKPQGSTPSPIAMEIRGISEPVQLGLTQIWWIVCAAFVLSTMLGIAVVILLLPKDLPEGPFWYCFAYFSTSFLANLAAAAAVYMMSYKSIKKWRDLQNQQLAEVLVVTPIGNLVRSCVSEGLKEWSTGGIREYKSLGDVNWKEVIFSAEMTIDICVQGWDGLIKNNISAWEEFFAKRQGRVNLFLPFVPENIEESRTLFHMAERLNRKEPKQADEIRDTHSLLQAIRDECAAGEVTHYAVEKMIWYCLIRVDEKVAYLSLYEHVHRAVTDSATFEIWLDRFPVTKRWIEKEINGLRIAAETS